MRHQTINDFRHDLHAIALRAQQGRTTFADAERLRSISEGLVEIELMLEKQQSKWHNPQQEAVR